MRVDESHHEEERALLGLRFGEDIARAICHPRNVARIALVSDLTWIDILGTNMDLADDARQVAMLGEERGRRLDVVEGGEVISAVSQAILAVLVRV